MTEEQELSLVKARTINVQTGRPPKYCNPKIGKKLSEKHLDVLDHYLDNYCQDPAAAWLSQYPNQPKRHAATAMVKLLAHPDAKKYVRKNIDEILSRSGLSDLKSQVIRRLSGEILKTGENKVKNNDLAKLSSVLSRICAWDSSNLIVEPPVLEIVITNGEPNANTENEAHSV